MATNPADASLLALTAASRSPITAGQIQLGAFVPGPALGTPQGNVEGMMLSMLNESSFSQGFMMNYVADMFMSYEKLRTQWAAMLGQVAKPAAAPKA
ncbi:MAG: hypothetical protein AMXMBFR33_61630 [Candidatus Xenobia bacterium]|jgi:hypothetical protein